MFNIQFFWVVLSCRHCRRKQHDPQKQWYQHTVLHNVISRILYGLNVPYLPWVHVCTLQDRLTPEDELFSVHNTHLAAHNTFKYVVVVYRNSINI
jgi:hypothetical protein